MDYFGRRAYLAQSPQLCNQVLVESGFERVYEVTAAYGAKPHNTARHLNEYSSLDVTRPNPLPGRARTRSLLWNGVR